MPAPVKLGRGKEGGSGTVIGRSAFFAELTNQSERVTLMCACEKAPGAGARCPGAWWCVVNPRQIGQEIPPSIPPGDVSGKIQAWACEHEEV